jgi:hypothetical protein
LCFLWQAGDGFDHEATLPDLCQTFALFFISGSNKVDTAVRQIVGSKFRQNFDNIAPEV